MPNIWWNSSVKPPETTRGVGKGVISISIFFNFFNFFFHVNLTKFHNIIHSLAQDAVNNAQFGAISVKDCASGTQWQNGN